MVRTQRVVKRSTLGAAALAVSLGAVGIAHGAAPFDNDVSTAIDRGLNFFATQGVYNNPTSLGGTDNAQGLAMLALLEKRATGNPSDPPQGYTGASAVDKGRLQTAAAFILDRVNETSFYAYRDGQWMFALASYALSGGPDKSTLAPGNADYQDIKAAMDTLVDRALANQRKPPAYNLPAQQGFWCYYNSGCQDSSTTQFMAAGLHAAHVFYASAKSGDQAFADPVRAAAVQTALALAKQGYELNAATNSENCGILTASERGHGYNSGNTPSAQQTASGIYIQLFGGGNVNSPMVQQYMEWVRNRYRYSDINSMGNGFGPYSHGYYLWSSFKAMEFIRQAAIAANPGNIGANDMGKLPAASAPACVQRQENRDPTALARPATFGVGGVGYYGAESKSQYFDYAYTLLNMQCGNGSFNCTGFQNDWVGYGIEAGGATHPSHNAYALLVLQRSTGVVIERCDINGDGKIDSTDIGLIRAAIGTAPGGNDARDYNADGKITVNDVRACTLKCTKPKCAP